jgi:hypothetical protein
VFTIESQLNITINGSDDANDYILLYNGDTDGQTYDNANRFYGNVGSYDAQTLTSNGFLSILINGAEYYMPVYKGSDQTDCCSNLIGTQKGEDDDIYTLAGYVLIKINGDTFKYTPVFSVGE